MKIALKHHHQEEAIVELAVVINSINNVTVTLYSNVVMGYIKVCKSHGFG